MFCRVIHFYNCLYSKQTSKIGQTAKRYKYYMRKYTTKFLKKTQVKPGEHVAKVIYTESSSKTRPPLRDRYLSALIAQR